MSSLNRRLNQFYDKHVTMSRHETSESVQRVWSLVLRILDKVHSLDKRFMIEPIPTGSYYQGLKVEKPNEFDYSIKLDVIPNWTWGGGKAKERCYGFDNPNVPDPAYTARDDIKIVSKATALPQAPLGYTFLGVGEPDRREGMCSFFLEAASNQSSDRGRMNALDDWKRRGIDNSGEACITHDGDVIPFLVKRRLKKLAEQVIRELDLQGNSLLRLSQSRGKTF